MTIRGLRQEKFYYYSYKKNLYARFYNNRTANRHRWVGRVYQGDRVNLC